MSERRRRFFLCIRNDGYAASLQVQTVYPALSDPEAESHRMLRIVDASGEDYLLPAEIFLPIEIPVEAAKTFAAAT
jgi:hypothetical protein